MTRIAPVSLMVCVAAATVFASNQRPVDIDTRAKGASQVVVARVVDTFSTFGVTEHGDQVILTHTQLQVEEALKGSPNQLVPLTIEGGTVGDLTLRVSDMPTLKNGDRGVFFLDADGHGGNRPHGRGLGVLKLDANNVVSGSDLTLVDIRKMVRAAGGQR
jgi:hypothetical protein